MKEKEEKNQIPKEYQDLVIERMEKGKANPKRLLNWDEVSKTL
ncbi:hypothetical protein [Flavobacterium cellulosilyticum]|nr:hypothetical protein [Flavobacterium cellulosilyticum]